MAEKSSHLDQLKIDRSARLPQRGFMLPVLIVLVLLGAGAGAAAYVWWPAPGIPVHAVSVEGAGGGGGGSGLDASGYVIAQRQATLSSQIVGKVVFLNAQEGEQVKQGDVIARLDDANYMAALHQAQAQERQAKAALDDAAPIYERYKRLQGQGAISTDQFENERAVYDTARTTLDVTQAAAVAVAQSNESYTTVRAPFNGVVTVKVAQVGDIVAPTGCGGRRRWQPFGHRHHRGHGFAGS